VIGNYVSDFKNEIRNQLSLDLMIKYILD